MDLQLLRKIELFQNLDPVQLAHLASIAEERKIPKNQILFKEGDESTEFYVIQKGRVRISKVVSGFGEEALAILGEGTYFGEMEIAQPEPRAAQALAHEECILQVFKISDFHDLLSTDKELAVGILWSFVRTLSRRLKETDDKVAATFALAQFK
jgi:CRP/FNR family transcriptional regulator, cyclic AMP receptor protein